MEGECARKILEPLYIQYGVDMVFTGAVWRASGRRHAKRGKRHAAVAQEHHQARPRVVHAGHAHGYERTFPIADYKLSKCGYIHVQVRFRSTGGPRVGVFP